MPNSLILPTFFHNGTINYFLAGKDWDQHSCHIPQLSPPTLLCIDLIPHREFLMWVHVWVQEL